MSLTIATIPSIINISQKPLTVKELLAVVDYKIDEIYIDKFWDSIEADKWIYIGDSMLEWIGYQSIDEHKPKERYLTLISKHFAIDMDYIHLIASDAKKFYSGKPMETPPDFNTHNKAKHIIVSPDCFKQSLMLMETAKAKQIRKYYVELEKVFKFYLQYQSKYQASQLEEEKSKNTNLRATAIDYNHLQKKEYLYIATTSRYASQNNFKVGKTIDLRARLSAYNTGQNKREPYYYVFISEPTYDAKAIEHVIKHILVKFRNSVINEIYVVNFDFLEKIVKRICSNYNDCIDYYNECISSETTHMGAVASIPVDVWDSKREVVVVDDDEPEVIEYYNDNEAYSFVRFRAEDKSMNFRCTRCDHVVARIDGLQSHFQRKIKCFDEAKDARIKGIRANAADPVMIFYRDNKDYGYFESYSDEKKCIEFNCSRCGYKSNNVVCMKRHFDRKTKCYEMEARPTPVRDANTDIETLDGIENHTFFRSIGEDKIPVLTCTHCDYQAPDPARMRRHFKRMKKCWT